MAKYLLLLIFLLSGKIWAQSSGSLLDSTRKYLQAKNPAKAEEFAIKAIEKSKGKKGKESLDFATSKLILGSVYNERGMFAKSEIELQEALSILQTRWKKEELLMADAHDQLAYVYFNFGKYKQADSLLVLALAVKERKLPADDFSFAKSYSMLGAIKRLQGDFQTSEKVYKSSLSIFTKKYGKNSKEVGMALMNLGMTYQYSGRIEEATDYISNAQHVFESVLPPDDPLISRGLFTLGSLAANRGQYNEAIKYYEQVIERTQNQPASAKTYFNAIGALGLAFFKLGNYKKAELYTIQGLESHIKSRGEENDFVANDYALLGKIYRNTGKPDKAKLYFEKSNAIWLKIMGEECPYLGEGYGEIALLCELSGDFKKAEIYFEKSNQFSVKLGENNLDFGIGLGMLAQLKLKMGQLQEAESLNRRAYEILRKIYSEKSPELAADYSGLGEVCFQQLKFEEAEKWFLKLLTNQEDLLFDYFPQMSANDKEKYVERIQKHLALYKAFTIDQIQSKPALVEKLYDQQIAFKGILLNSTLKWKKRVQESSDTVVKFKFNQWTKTQEMIGLLIEKGDSAAIAQVEILTQANEKLEQELSKRTNQALSSLKDARVSWLDIQKKLQPGEAAIEMIRIQKYGIQKMVTDTSDPKKPVYKVKGITDTIYYAALLLKPESKIPEMVLLKNGNYLEEKWIRNYNKNIRQNKPDLISYNQFWKAIGQKIGPGTKRLFFSPDGVYNTLNLNTLQNPKTGKYLLDEFEIRLVTNTRDILNANESAPNKTNAILVGNPDYNMDPEKRALAFQEKSREPAFNYDLQLTRSDAFVSLPSTKTEVENISSVMVEKGWKVQALVEEKALEESIKSGISPGVLHIATHGFFEPDSTKGNNPLLHSGLLLAGANKSLAGKKDQNLEDGILTAYEAMNLNLDNTDLVVLSACETGLGEVKNGEGVYGLQRAFKVAGAKSIIMSLWKVSDKATKELMVGFYKNWLGLAASSKRSAFLKTQKELKAKYPDPYYWGAFVMVGE